jgi:hypothetical protein
MPSIFLALACLQVTPLHWEPSWPQHPLVAGCYAGKHVTGDRVECDAGALAVGELEHLARQLLPLGNDDFGRTMVLEKLQLVGATSHGNRPAAEKIDQADRRQPDASRGGCDQHRIARPRAGNLDQRRLPSEVPGPQGSAAIERRLEGGLLRWCGFIR